HRPVGLGIMGFQDALWNMGLSYASEQAVTFADRSMETAKPAIDQASEAAKDAYEKAKEATKEAYDKAKESVQQPKQ
ncbi:MAG: hypothetical protein J0I75_08420, partial [Hyphomicrobium sp.]|nr:hypothetical protein [Hyphomicrobium sp.]